MTFVFVLYCILVVYKVVCKVILDMNVCVRYLRSLSCCRSNLKHVGVLPHRLWSSKNDHVTAQLEILKNILQGDYDTVPLHHRVITDPLGSPIMINIVRVFYLIRILFVCMYPVYLEYMHIIYGKIFEW